MKKHAGNLPFAPYQPNSPLDSIEFAPFGNVIINLPQLIRCSVQFSSEMFAPANVISPVLLRYLFHFFTKIKVGLIYLFIYSPKINKFTGMNN